MLADVAVVRAQPELFGPVASDPTVSRLIATLAGDVDAAVAAIRAARARPASGSGAAAAAGRCRDGGQVIVDLDATLVTAHSDKERREPTFKRGFGFTRCARSSTTASTAPGDAGWDCCAPARPASNSAADHIAVLDAALAQLPEAERGQVLVRTDTGGGVKAFLHHITDLGLQYSVGFYGMPPIVEALGQVPAAGVAGRPRR